MSLVRFVASCLTIEELTGKLFYPMKYAHAIVSMASSVP